MPINKEMFKEKLIDVRDLLLDPNNPRFSKHLDDKMPLIKIAEPDVQKYAFSQMQDPENRFEIPELISAILADGFMHVDKIFVQQIGEKYLVIEGNRRITAIKKILESADEISDELREQISKIPCVVIDSNDPESENLVRKILGLRHHGSILPWKPLPAAFNLYQQYMVELCSADINKINNPVNFVYNPSIAKKVASMFSVRLSDVRNKVRLYRVYLQLKEVSKNHPNVVNPDSFSMIQETLSREALVEYFDYDEATSTFSEEGVELILDLYFGLKEKPPVITEASAGGSNVRDFAYVVSEGTPENIRQITEDRLKAGDVKTIVAAKVLRHSLHRALEVVLNELNKINLGEISVDGFAPNEKDSIVNIDKKIAQLKRASGLT